MTLVPGQRYRVILQAYELQGEFEATFLRIDGVSGDDHALAIWSNGVKLAMWGQVAEGWRVELVEAEPPGTPSG